MKSIGYLIIILGITMSISCKNTNNSNQTTDFQYKEKGMAICYEKSFEGKKTASGETFNPEKLTAAHPSLGFGTKVKVTNLENNESVLVTINDRGPINSNYLIKLSNKAAQKIGILKKRQGRVEVKKLKNQ